MTRITVGIRIKSLMHTDFVKLVGETVRQTTLQHCSNGILQEYLWLDVPSTLYARSTSPQIETNFAVQPIYKHHAKSYLFGGIVSRPHDQQTLHVQNLQCLDRTVWTVGETNKKTHMNKNTDRWRKYSI